MNTKNNRLINKYLPYFLIATVTILYFIVNKRMWLYGDDYYYSTNIVTGNDLTSVRDIIESQVWHYFNWGGRSVAHSLLQLLFLTNDTLIDVINVVSLLLLAFFANKLMEKPSLLSFSAIYSGLILFTASWIETLLWQTGVANYLYMGVFQFIFIYIYYKGMDCEKKKEWLNVFMIPLGLFVGWSNENMGPAIFIGIAAIIVYRLKKYKNCPIWMYTGALLNAIGSAFLILAPGNHVRSEEIDLGLSPILTILSRILSIGSAFFVYMVLPIAFAIISVVLYKAVFKLKFDFFDFVLLGMSILSWGAMIMAAHYPVRATFGTVVLLSTFSFRLLSKTCLDDTNRHKYLMLSGVIFIWIGAVYKFLEFCC